jgi:hypothetical protein
VTCSTCSAVDTTGCEWPLEGPGKLCNRKLCDACAQVVDAPGMPDARLCPEHAERFKRGELS